MIIVTNGPAAEHAVQKKAAYEGFHGQRRHHLVEVPTDSHLAARPRH